MNDSLRKFFLFLLVLISIDVAVCFAEPLKVGIRSANKTFEFQKSNGTPAGLLVDVWTYWGERHKLSVEFVPSDEKGLLKLLRSGEIDIIANAIPDAQVVVSEPYLSYDYYLISQKQSPLSSLDEIPIRVGILQRDDFLAQVLPGDVRLKSYQSYQDLLVGIRSGDINFILVNDMSLNYSVFGTELITLYYPEEPFYSHPVTAGSLVQNSDLLAEVNSGMRLLDTQRVEQIKRRWNLSTVGFKLPWAFIGFAVFVLLAVIALVMTWLLNKKLEHQIEAQTHEIKKQKLALEKDIERRIVVEKELKQAKLAADSAAEARTQFLSTLTHELRTPLVGVLGMNELLLQTELDNNQKALANTVQQSGETLLSLISDILDFSKIESGSLALNTASVHVGDIVKQTISTFSERAKKQGIQLSYVISPEACRVVTVDPLRLKQILMNLIGNAVKFTLQGSVTVRLDMDLENNSIGRFSFDIEDTGIGISPEDQLVIFDAFTQVDRSRKRSAGGTGLGLSIVWQLVDAMNGEITVKSQLNRGSHFCVTLPLALVERREKEDRLAGQLASVPPVLPQKVSMQGNDRSPKTHKGTDNAGRRILVADDYAVTRELIRIYLRDANILMDEVGSGKEVLAIAQKHAYELILMDCNMPEVDGIETTRLLRQRGYGGPIVLMSAHVDIRIYEECMKAGMDDQLPKPFKRNDLNNILNKWLPDPVKVKNE